MKILIVDDEQPARQRLKDLVQGIEPGHVLLEAADGLQALRMVESEQPDVVLLDIRMPGMDGLEAARHMASLHPAPAVLFTTAYDEHALKAFDANAVDYLLKPIRRERLKTGLEKARIHTHAQLLDLDREARRTHISSVVHGSLVLIPVREVRYFKADLKYVTVGWPGHEALIDDPLKALEEEFGDRFLRIHRNALVAPGHVESLHKDGDGNLWIGLRGMPERLTVSRRHAGAVRSRLKNLSLSV